MLRKKQNERGSTPWIPSNFIGSESNSDLQPNYISPLGFHEKFIVFSKLPLPFVRLSSL